MRLELGRARGRAGFASRPWCTLQEPVEARAPRTARARATAWPSPLSLRSPRNPRMASRSTPRPGPGARRSIARRTRRTLARSRRVRHSVCGETLRSSARGTRRTRRSRRGALMPVRVSAQRRRERLDLRQRPRGERSRRFVLSLHRPIQRLDQPEVRVHRLEVRGSASRR